MNYNGVTRVVLMLMVVLLWPSYNVQNANIFKPSPVEALSTMVTVNDCFIIDGASDSTCTAAISGDGSTSQSFTKNDHIDAPFVTFSAATVTSATLYYDSWATLSGTWALYVKDSRDGTILCSVDPAPEDATEANNSVSCSITAAQLNAGLWFQADNNDGAGPELVYLDYVYLAVEYTAGASITLSSDGTTPFGVQALNTTKDTTSGDLNDVQTIFIDSGPVDLDIRSGNFTDGGNTWTLGASNGASIMKLESSPDGSAWTTLAIADTLYTLYSNVATSSSNNFYLRLTTPTTTNSYNEYSGTVTVVASTP